MIVQWTPDDLEAIRVIVQEELSKLINKPAESLYTREELCDKLGINKSTFHRHIKSGKLKVERIGNKLKIIQ
jgi:excisionase family DNA binding protein